MTKAYLAVTGKPRDELDLEEGATIKDALAAAGVSVQEGAIVMVGDSEANLSDAVAEGHTVFYIPPVSLGF